jgi:hypothetical protein
MHRRQNQKLWNLVIDEFAEYVANEGSMETLAHVFTQGRKFGLSLSVAHQDISQLTPEILGALSNVQTKVIFGVGRPEAEYFAKSIGRVDPDMVKRAPKTETQQELFSPLSEQWEKWIDGLRFQSDRQATVSTRDGRVIRIKTIEIPSYTATEEHVETVRRESLARFGVPYPKAMENLKRNLSEIRKRTGSGPKIPPFEVIGNGEE